MRSSALDRDSLVARNRRMAEALHRRSRRHQLRDALLRFAARAPMPSGRGETKRLLVIRPDHLGDALLATPAIQALKRSRPELAIHALCSLANAELLANYAEIERVITLPFPGFQRGDSSMGNPYRLAFQWAGRLRRIGYDSAIVMRQDHWWGALLAWLAGIPERIGYDTPAVRPFLTVAQPLERVHAVERNMRLVERFAGPPSAALQLEFTPRQADMHAVSALLADWGVSRDQVFICIHPGAGAASKLWTGEGWARVADRAASRYQAAVVLTGAKNEISLCQEIAAAMQRPATIAAGATTVGQLAALFKSALAVAGPDNGALHLASAVGRPTVALFGPADPLEFAPWGDRRRQAVVTAEIGCRPCRILDWRGDDPACHPCLREISPEQVLAALERALAVD